MKAFERPRSLTDLVTGTLREWIISGSLDLGSRISEASIAKELGVSRTPVREAINRLEMEGMVSVEPQSGTYVFNLEVDELAKLCDARVCLETASLRSAIEQDAEALHDALHACVGEMRAARERGDDTAYLALDTRFHQCFFDCADNIFLNDAYQTIAQKMAAMRNRLGRHPDHMAKSFEEHVLLAEAVGRKDTDRALAILRPHIDRKEGSYWTVATKPE